MYSYTPGATTWVSFQAQETYGGDFAILDDAQNQIYCASFNIPASGLKVKALGGKTLYFVIRVYGNEGWSGTITLACVEAPVLAADQLKCWASPSGTGMPHKASKGIAMWGGPSR